MTFKKIFLAFILKPYSSFSIRKSKKNGKHVNTKLLHNLAFKNLYSFFLKLLLCFSSSSSYLFLIFFFIKIMKEKHFNSYFNIKVYENMKENGFPNPVFYKTPILTLTSETPKLPLLFSPFLYLFSWSLT